MPDRLSPVTCAVTVPTRPDLAFAAFAESLGLWWPRDYTFSGHAMAGAVIEPAEGGLWYEWDADGQEKPWGRVIACEPPGRLVLGWQIGIDRQPEPDPAKASEVEVRFTDGGNGGTRVDLEHRAFERHGESGAQWRAGMGSPRGWPLILDRFRQFMGPAEGGTGPGGGEYG
jgi:uncharacterized protein YndB with AHSA1/START domain